MASFADFLATFDPDAGKRGRQFEHFVKWFLKNDPEWATQVDEVWLWNDYPGQWGRDCGIDLAFRDKTGSVWAVQAKCYSPSYEITKADVDKFLSESNRKQINHRLLIATTDGIGANASRHQSLVLTRLKRLTMSYLAFKRLIVGNLLWLAARAKHLFACG
jgi:predicted helicase